MKKVIIICIILIIVSGVVILGRKKSPISDFQYDIVVAYKVPESNKVTFGIKNERIMLDNKEDNPFPKEGGYASIYKYTVINSEKKEKYSVIYQDVYAEKNKDYAIITVTPISDYEVENAIKQYGISKRKNKLKKLLDKASRDRYEVKIKYDK